MLAEQAWAICMAKLEDEKEERGKVALSQEETVREEEDDSG